jgi:hypothetical protein
LINGGVKIIKFVFGSGYIFLVLFGCLNKIIDVSNELTGYNAWMDAVRTSGAG